MANPVYGIPGLGGFLGMQDIQQQNEAQQVRQMIGLASLVNQQRELALKQKMAPIQMEELNLKLGESRRKADQAKLLDEAIAKLPPEQQSLARIAPNQFVSGLSKNPMEGMPDSVKLQELRLKYENDGTPEGKRRAAEITGILTRRSEGDKMHTMTQLQAQGYPEDVARGIAFGLLKVVSTADGGVRLIRTDQALAGGSSGVPTPSGGPVSPYATQPPLPGEIGGTPGARPARELNEEVQQLTKVVGDKKIPALDQSMEALDEIFSKYQKGGVPGIGLGQTGNPIAGAIYGVGSAAGNSNAEEAQRIRGQLKAWTNMITRASAGLSQTVTETANVLAETMTKSTSSEADIRNAYERWKKAYLDERATAFAGADPRVVSEFYRRKGQQARFSAESDADGESLAKRLQAMGIKNFRVDVNERGEARQVKRTGTLNGKKVIEYTDGTVEVQ